MEPEKTIVLIEKLEKWFDHCDSCVVAFSGGIDSSLVAYLARRFLGPQNCLAVIGSSSSLKQKDYLEAREFASRHDIPLEIVETMEMDDPAYLANPENRCYHCKSELFTQLETVRQRMGFKYILGGENLDDHSDYRPGLEAAAQFKVRGPLAECSINKDELRVIARHFKLECWEKPASPCLSSRIPYFNEITNEKLKQIEAGEELLEAQGFPVSRVRHHSSFARIEVPSDQVSKLLQKEAEISSAFETIGFQYIEIDPEGFVSGKMNRVLE